MKMNYIIALVVVALAAGGFVVFSQNTPVPPSALDGFAQCLKDKGVIFYGAFWCPHCQAQKKLFGTAERYLPYVECSLPNGQTQTQVCIDKGIKSYPTWVFPDGSQLNGEVPLATLAEKSTCTLPTP